MTKPSSGDTFVPMLCWLLASLATAFCAHALIDSVGDRLDRYSNMHADAYAAHEHGSIVPIAQLIATLLVSLLLLVATRAVARKRHNGDGIGALAERLRWIRPAHAIGFVAVGGLAILVGMEFLEQAAAFGHVGSVAEALGGNVAIGLALVGGVAAALTAAGLRVVGAFVAVTAATALSIASWIVARLDAALVDVLSGTGRTRRPRGRAGALPGLYASSCCGLRAPPISA
jgi:hypothetical protein